MDERPVSVGILQTGVLPEAIAGRFDSYADMMRSMLGAGFEYTVFDITRQHFPATPDQCGAYVITGSSAGVYDDLPWIAPLSAFLRAARGKSKLVGICFGHQIMAQAFGGQVEKSKKGWGLGLHRYALVEPLAEGPDSIAIAVSHQDQVIVPPDDARILGGNAFTPNGVLAYGGEALSFQCHPEFDPDFAAELVELCRDRLPGTADALIASLQEPNDRLHVASWIRRFIQG